jgi:tungstate transport system permease protein
LIDRAVADAIWVSLVCSVAATVLATLLGAPIGTWLGRRRFRGRRVLLLVARTGMALPTVLIGLLVYSLVSRSGPFGGTGILYTKTAIVVGELALALPIVVALFSASTEALPPTLEATARTLGAGRMRTFLTVLAEARLGLLVAVLAAFGRIVSELGIAMMLGGNVKHHTRTMTTAIALETQKGDFAESIALGLVLLAISLVVNAVASGLDVGRRAREAHAPA